MTDVLLALNAGSSSIKFSLFVTRGETDTLSFLYRGGVEGIGSEPRFLVDDSRGQRLVDERLTAKKAGATLGHEETLGLLLARSNRVAKL